MAIIQEQISQEEYGMVVFQALGILLKTFQDNRKVDHMTFDFNGFTYKIGADEKTGQIVLEKHELDERPEPKEEKKIVTLEEFANGL